MADPRPIFEYNEESQADKFARKSKDSPFMIVGMVTGVVAVLLRSWRFKALSDTATAVAHHQTQNLFVPSLGILGLIGVCGLGAYKYKTKGKMSTSVFLMQLRVAAQGTVVAALTVGLAYTLAKEHLFKDKKD